MVFNFRGFLRFMAAWLGGGSWTPRRAAIVVAFFLFFPMIAVLVWAGFFFDYLRFRRYRQMPVEAPVFIIGNPRSGTTFLHRLLAKDTNRFTTMQMWQILLAPAITQRLVVERIAAARGRMHAWIHAKMDRLEKGWSAANVMHTVSLRKPEEDDYLLLHIWSALTIGLSAGLLQKAIPYTYFDTALPKSERRRIMAFYRQCIQRHLYAEKVCENRPRRQYLAKNPALSPKVRTVREFFPDGKFIYLVRNPLHVLPSYVSMIDYSWRVLGIPNGDRSLRAYIIAMARHWYLYPLEQLARLPDENYIIVRYDDLVEKPEQTIQSIYARFGFDLGAEFAAELSAQSARSRDYRSRHHYSLEALGLSREMILTEFQDVFERFGFDTTY